ncbi:intermembrane transport protein PqiB [Motilimonas cestriensis]|uniref:Intermembrane transport protein PqiB n=1 Tax=Motilimonas cestriensis TaxID=2742685 RepID=A0ABS8WA54_9GAMM|nr:intermembrane transport protein PqiB [Motilimonas cestriensis]
MLENQPERISKVWLVPVLALMIGAWMLYQHISSQGPLIRLEISNAEGLEAGKTKVKSLSVEIGVVEDIELSDDYSKAILSVRIDPHADKMLVEDSVFWVVKPRVGKTGVSGLGTLFSGAYLELKPGSSNKKVSKFQVMENPPLISSDTQGLRLRLTNNASKALSDGAPINFRGFEVGRIETVSYDIESRQTQYDIFIFSPYDALVTSNTRFWMKPGVSLSLDAKGIQFEMDSLESVITGGITFGLPTGWEPGERITQNSQFYLFTDEATILTESYDNYLEYVLFFDESIAGLNVGSPVQFKGIQVGQVKEIPYLKLAPNYQYEFQDMIPVLIRIEFDRWRTANNGDVEYWSKVIDRMLNRGLHARLKTANLLTGARLIDLTVQEDAVNDPDQLKLAQQLKVKIIPTMKGGFDQLEQKVSQLLDKINNLEIETTIHNANALLKTTEQSMRAIDQIMTNEDTQGLPKEFNNTLAQANETLRSYSKDSQLHKDLSQTVRALEQSLRELQPFLRKISAKPNAIIFDGKTQRDPRLENK